MHVLQPQANISGSGYIFNQFDRCTSMNGSTPKSDRGAAVACSDSCLAHARYANHARHKALTEAGCLTAAIIPSKIGWLVTAVRFPREV